MPNSNVTILGTSDHSTLVPPESAADKHGQILLFKPSQQSQQQAEKATVATPHPAWIAMNRRWALIDALMAGTLAMRAWRTEFLPQEEGELDEAYEQRLRRTFLFNGLRDAVLGIVAKPFSRDSVVKEHDKMDERAQAWVDNTDGKGTHMTSMLAQLFLEANLRGFAHIFTDIPPRPEGFTAADEKNRLPTSRMISPKDLFNWQFNEFDNKLERIHIRETVSRPAGQWGTEFVTQIRVVWRDRFEVYQPSQQKARGGQIIFELVAEGPMLGPDGKPLDKIPLRTLYLEGSKIEDMVAAPPHQDLAELNLDHWQTYSDYANICHYANVPIIFGKAMSNEEEKAVKVVAITSAILAEAPEADVKYVEHTGKAIAASREKLKDLIQAMAKKGSDPLMPNRPGDVTATEIAMQGSQSQSKVQRWITDEQSVANNVLEDVHFWLGAELPEEASVDIFQDFTVVGERQDADILSNMQLKGQLSLPTLLHEFRRRGILSEALDIQKELERIEEDEDSTMMPELAPKPDEEEEEEEEENSEESGEGGAPTDEEEAEDA